MTGTCGRMRTTWIADGDGIVDVIEAGLPDANLNGISGWGDREPMDGQQQYLQWPH
ncbi:MAG: hypothetical protein IPG38_02485 [Chitinophagaceae bacterium]|nr:hypothetical protein [Chitinophagaceae bacterium]